MIVLRRDKTSPITKLEYDNNITELSNRVTLDTDQVITGIKTFKNFPKVTVGLADYSDSVGNYAHLDAKKTMFSDLAKSGSIITGTKTFNQPVTVNDGNALTLDYFNFLNTQSIHFSTELPINPDLNPVSLFWGVLDINNNITAVYRYITGAWELTPPPSFES